MKNSADQGGCYPPMPQAALLTSLVQYGKILSKVGHLQLAMVNYACGFNRSEKG